jgi:hypothetical protein
MHRHPSAGQFSLRERLMDGLAFSLFLLATFGVGCVLIVYSTYSLAAFGQAVPRLKHGGSPQ